MGDLDQYMFRDASVGQVAPVNIGTHSVVEWVYYTCLKNYHIGNDELNELLAEKQ